MLNTEQFAATNKAQAEALLGLTAKALGGAEQIIALNLQAAKAGLDRAREAGLAMVSVRDPQSLIAVQSSLLQPAVDDASEYGQQVYRIVGGFGADMEKLVAKQTAAAQSALAALIEEAGKHAPVGSGGGIDLIKSSFATANGALESFRAAGAKAVETAEANFASVTKAARKTKRA